MLVFSTRRPRLNTLKSLWFFRRPKRTKPMRRRIRCVNTPGFVSLACEHNKLADDNNDYRGIGRRLATFGR